MQAVERGRFIGGLRHPGLPFLLSSYFWLHLFIARTLRGSLCLSASLYFYVVCLHLSLSLYISLSLSLYISRFYVIYSYIYVHTTFYPYLPLPSLPVVLFISSLSPDLSLSLSLSLISSSLRLSSCPQGSLSRFRSPLPSSIFPLR